MRARGPRAQQPDPVGNGLWRRVHDDCVTAARRAPTLTALLRSHVTSVPFENLDVASGIGVRTGLDWSLPKILERNRVNDRRFEPLSGIFKNHQAAVVHWNWLEKPGFCVTDSLYISCCDFIAENI